MYRSKLLTFFEVSAPGSNATSDSDKGLMGLGAPEISSVAVALNGTRFDGSPALVNLFATNPSLSPYITFALSRSFSNELIDGGVFTIGEINSTYSDINNEPKIPLLTPDLWVVALDGIIVNGNNLTGGSST